MFMIIVLSVATLLTLYVGLRLIEPLSIRRSWKLLLWLMTAILLYGQRFTWFFRGRAEGALWLELVNWAAYLFLGLVTYVVILMLIRDVPLLLAGVARLGRKAGRALFGAPATRKLPVNPSRRGFLVNASNAAIMAAALPVTGYGVYEARKVPDVNHVDLPIIGLHPDLEGMTIAQITDTHIGPTIQGEWLAKVVKRTNELNADIILHTGDMVDGSVANLRQYTRHFADLKAPLGVWFCTGNHEYYSGVTQWLDEIRRMGITPLNNEHRLLDVGKARLLLAGVTDIRGDRSHSSPAKAKQGAPDHDLSLLLAHEPLSVFDASDARFDIQLSGHTHGGQMFPFTYAIHWFQPYVRGLHQHENTLLYVSRGTGYWGPPIRLGSPPEITLHTLRRA